MFNFLLRVTRLRCSLGTISLVIRHRGHPILLHTRESVHTDTLISHASNRLHRIRLVKRSIAFISHSRVFMFFRFELLEVRFRDGTPSSARAGNGVALVAAAPHAVPACETGLGEAALGET